MAHAYEDSYIEGMAKAIVAEEGLVFDELESYMRDHYYDEAREPLARLDRFGYRLIRHQVQR